MSLESDYELLERLRDDGVQSFRANEKSTGRNLEIHLFLPFGQPDNKNLFEKLKGLPLESRRKFLDIGMDGSTPYIVTDPLPAVSGFKEWAKTLVTPEKRPQVDESVQILQAGQWRTGTPLPESLVTAPRTAAAAHDLTMVFPSDTGDFTKMISQPGLISDASIENHLPRTVAPQPTQRGTEFTQVFGKFAFTPESSPVAPPLPPAPTPLAPPPVSISAPARSNAPLFVALGVLATLAILVVAYLLVRHR